MADLVRRASPAHLLAFGLACLVAGVALIYVGWAGAGIPVAVLAAGVVLAVAVEGARRLRGLLDAVRGER